MGGINGDSHWTSFRSPIRSRRERTRETKPPTTTTAQHKRTLEKNKTNRTSFRSPIRSRRERAQEANLTNTALGTCYW